MTTTYSRFMPDDNEECHKCGAPADMRLVAESLEDGTGYQDVRPLCQRCFEQQDEQHDYWAV